MALAADLARKQLQAMDLRRALLLDGLLAGGPSLSSQMILLRNEALPPPLLLKPQQQYYHLPQQEQYDYLPPLPPPEHLLQQQANSGNAITQGFTYPLQGYVGQRDEPLREVGAAGTTPQDQISADNLKMASGLQSHASLNVSSGLGFHSVEYVQPVGPLPESYAHPYPHGHSSLPESYAQPYPHGHGPLPESYVQPYPHAQSTTSTASNYEASLYTWSAQQNYLQQPYSIAPSTEVYLNPPITVNQGSLTSGLKEATPAARDSLRDSSIENDRRHTMIHAHGNGSHSHLQSQTPNAQPPNNPSIPLEQGSSLPSVEELVQKINLQQQRIREIELQHLLRRQLEIDSQRRTLEQLKQREQSLQQPRNSFSAQIGKNKVLSRNLQNSGNKGKSKLPAAAGPEGPGWCALCQTDCNTAEMLQFHLAGKKHQKKLQLLGTEADAPLANASAAQNEKTVSDVFESYSKSCLQTSTTLEIFKKREFAGIGAPSSEPAAKRVHLSNQGSGVLDQQLLQKSLLTERCDICNIWCNTKEVLELHFKGKKHAANLQKLARSAQANATEWHQGTNFQKGAERGIAW